MTSDPPSPPRVAFDAQEISRGIDLLAQGILSRHPDPAGLALVGVHTGGDLLVRRVEEALSRLSGRRLELDKGLVDITFYRDDWSRLTQSPRVRATQIHFDVEGRQLVLVDDVIFTGRTVRSALEALFALGRPARVELAVLVDRGHREFPIQPDHVGLKLSTQCHQSVNVFIFGESSQDYVTLEDHKYHTATAASS